MTRFRQRWTEHQVEQMIGALLRGGVILSAVVVFVGGVLYLIHYGTTAPNYQVFHGEPTDLRTLPGILTAASSLQRRGLIQFGLLLLIATPIVRVGFTAFAFAQQRDRTYLLITLVVLAILLYSLLSAV